MKYLLLLLILNVCAHAQLQWVQRPSPGDVYEAAGRPGLYLAATATGLVRSTDGVTWAATPLTARPLLLYSDGSVIAGFDEDKFWSTADGSTFRSTQIITSRPISCAHNATTWVTVCSDGRIFVSADQAMTWQAALSPAGSLAAVAYGAGKFVAATEGGDLLFSTDGRTWTISTAANPLRGYGTTGPMVFAGNAFYWEGYYSTNGLSGWTALAGGRKGIQVAGGLYVMGFDQYDSSLCLLSAGRWTCAHYVVGDSFIEMTYCGDIWLAFTAGGKFFTHPSTGPVPVRPPVTIAPAVQVSWPSTAGLWYQVQRSTNGTTWTDTGSPVMGDGSVMKWTAPASAGKEFFRVSVR